MKLKIGMIVNYKPTGHEMGIMKEKQSVCNIKEALPAVVVAIDEENEEVNLKVLLDGQGDIWAKNVKQGEEVGQWEYFEFDEDEETAFINEINALIVKLAQQKNDIIELLASIREDIESSKIILAEIQKAKAEIVVASVTNNPITASETNNTEMFEVVNLKVMESATEKEANAKKV